MSIRRASTSRRPITVESGANLFHADLETFHRDVRSVYFPNGKSPRYGPAAPGTRRPADLLSSDTLYLRSPNGATGYDGRGTDGLDNLRRDGRIDVRWSSNLAQTVHTMYNTSDGIRLLQGAERRSIRCWTVTHAHAAPK
jgi:hypothetical protein